MSDSFTNLKHEERRIIYGELFYFGILETSKRSLNNKEDNNLEKTALQMLFADIEERFQRNFVKLINLVFPFAGISIIPVWQQDSFMEIQKLGSSFHESFREMKRENGKQLVTISAESLEPPLHSFNSCFCLQVRTFIFICSANC
jgi:hypothetical protein